MFRFRARSWSRGRVSWLRLFAVSGALGAACSSETSAEGEADAAPPSETGFLGDGFLGAGVCDVCIAEKCGGYLRTCDADASCRALRFCRAACADAACDARCLAELGPDAGAHLYMDSLALCAEYNCPSDCAGAPASDEQVAECHQRFDESLGEVSGPCERACACQNCNSEWLECFSDPDCTMRLGCALRQCSAVTLGCLSDCFRDGGLAVGGDISLAFRRAFFCAEHHCDACLAEDG